MKILTFLFAFLVSPSFYALTWDEPWQKDIIEKSEYLILGEVMQASDSLVHVKVQKSFGEDLEGILLIDGFFMLDVCSSSGHGPELDFEIGERGYFFLKKNEKGRYEIPTPSSGFDRIVDDKVYATFRHTYHQALLNPNDYELAYSAIWGYYHGQELDKKKTEAFILEQLNKEVAGFDEEEIGTFFLQHAALELVYHLNMEIPFPLLKKFMVPDHFHAQVSALRAMGANSSVESVNFLISHIKDKNQDAFTQLMAVRALDRKLTRQHLEKLKAIKDEVSDEEISFGGNIMDPRVCTSLPSPKQALLDYLALND